MTTHEQALARIEEWERDLCETGMCDATPIAQKSLAMNKAVLELHKRSDLVFTSNPIQYACEGCGARSPDKDFLCPTADLIIKGVL